MRIEREREYSDPEYYEALNTDEKLCYELLKDKFKLKKIF